MRDRSPSEQLIQQLAAGKLFRMVSVIQLGIHLAAYIAAFIGLIIIKAGGYYDTEIIRFIGLTLVSMPLFAIGLWLLQRSLKLSQRQRWWGYCFHLVVSLWSITIVKIGYWL
jgi:ABC-type dipeptide/oligopeptide/nickel transport system permease component